MAIEYCRVQTNFFFRRFSAARNSKNRDLQLEQKEKIFLMFIRLPSEVPDYNKNIHFCKIGEHLNVTLDFSPKKQP